MMHTRQSAAVPALEQDSPVDLGNILELTAPALPAMYAPAYTADWRLTHSPECRRMFERGDWQCPRCAELEEGKAVRGSWHQRHFRKKLNQVQRFLPLAS